MPSDPDPERFQDPKLQFHLLRQVEERLAVSTTDPILARLAGDLARSSGELAAAGRHYALAAALNPDDHAATALAHLFRGELPATGDRRLQRAVPFVRIENLLPAANIAAISAELRSPEIALSPNWIGVEKGKAIDPEFRNSHRLRDVGRLADIVLPQVGAAIERSGALPILGLEHLRLSAPDLSVNLHVHGGIFRPHKDVGYSNPLRRLTYVYYFHTMPRRFTGGDLLLFDDDIASGTYQKLSYTRIPPDHNSLVLFPSDRIHGVTAVECPRVEPIDARWTLNGWLHEIAGDQAS